MYYDVIGESLSAPGVLRGANWSEPHPHDACSSYSGLKWWARAHIVSYFVPDYQNTTTVREERSGICMGVKHSHHEHHNRPPLFPARSSAYFDYPAYKVVVMGSACTGKSCCIERFARSGVFYTTCSSIFDESNCKRLDVILDETRIVLHLWEVGFGLFRSRFLPEMYYRRSQGLIAVYDVTRNESFEQVPYWIETAKLLGHPEAPIMLVGNKCDSTELLRKEVRYETARDFTDEHNYSLFEVSAKDGTNVEMALMSLVTRIRLKHLEHLVM